jgi:3-oxoacyl-[acyl-carrier-protein] synthase-3
MGKITAAITAVQGYVPEHILSNEDLAKLVDTSDEWITTRTGIKERRIMKDGASSDMAAAAAKALLEKKGIDPLDIELVIIGTVTPDHPFPSTANIVCDKVGMKMPGVLTSMPLVPDFCTRYQLVLSSSKRASTKKF